MAQAQAMIEGPTFPPEWDTSSCGVLAYLFSNLQKSLTIRLTDSTCIAVRSADLRKKEITKRIEYAFVEATNKLNEYFEQHKDNETKVDSLLPYFHCHSPAKSSPSPSPSIQADHK